MKDSLNHKTSVNIEIKDNKVIKKAQSEDFLYQIRWFLELPNELRDLIPKVYSFSLEEKFIELEYYPEGSIDKYFVHGNYQIIQNALLFLDNIIDRFSKYKKTANSEDIYNMYYVKTVERLNKLKQIGDQEIRDILQREYIYINEERMFGISKIIELSKKYVDKFIINEYQLIHGDLCFNNILKSNQSFVLIDPRGMFGNTFMYGDVKYDIAKISHSLLGGYDFIMFDKFKLLRNEGYILEYPKTNIRIPKLQHIHIDANIRYIEAHLFLSMTPLHIYNLERVKAMLINGIRLFNLYSIYL